MADIHVNTILALDLGTSTGWALSGEDGTIKKHATGKGNASKEQMIDAVKARGYTPVDDNEADALALLYWAIEGGNA